MRITPLDIRKQEFRKTMRGLDGDEVYAFLTTVAEEYETVLSDNKRLRERIVEIEDRLMEFKSMETNLRNTLLTAERITAEAKENAHREAGLIVREAEIEAEKAAEAIRVHTQQLRREILELKKQKDNYITRLRTLLESQQNIVIGFEDDFAEVDREIEKIGQKVEADSNAAVHGTRMSRNRITEDFAREPKGKVTWDDERRREDVPRPAMPRQGHEAEKAPDRKASPPREEASTAAPVATGARDGYAVRRSAEPGYSQVRQPARDNPSSRGAGRSTVRIVTGSNLETSRVDYAGVDAVKVEIADETDSGPDGHFNERENRRDIARKIEDTMYPEANIHENAAVTGRESHRQMTAVGYQGPIGEDLVDGSLTPPGAQAEPERSRDDWKSYEVQNEKQDWSGYEINRGAHQAVSPEPGTAIPREGGQGLYAASSPPSDNEVEEALSGLEEITDSGRKDHNPHIGQRPHGADPRVVEHVVPEKAYQPKDKSEVRPADDGADREQADKSGATWSMDELRRNLTNIDRNEE